MVSEALKKNNKKKKKPQETDAGIKIKSFMKQLMINIYRFQVF